VCAMIAHHDYWVEEFALFGGGDGVVDLLVIDILNSFFVLPIQRPTLINHSDQFPLIRDFQRHRRFRPHYLRRPTPSHMRDKHWLVCDHGRDESLWGHTTHSLEIVEEEFVGVWGVLLYFCGAVFSLKRKHFLLPTFPIHPIPPPLQHRNIPMLLKITSRNPRKIRQPQIRFRRLRPIRINRKSIFIILIDRTSGWRNICSQVHLCQ